MIYICNESQLPSYRMLKGKEEKRERRVKNANVIKYRSRNVQNPNVHVNRIPFKQAGDNGIKL